MFYVYILHSQSADKFYVGQTENVENRLSSHNELSENSFTSKYRPWAVKRVIEVKTRSEAMILERYIKKRKSRKYIQQLIQYDKIVLDLIQKKLPA